MTRRVWEWIGGAMIVAAALFLALLVNPPTRAEALRLDWSRFGTGDSVRYVARFTVPTAPLDSITVRWSLTGNANKFHRFVAPFGATVTDTALFSAPGCLGGCTYAGNILVRTWIDGAVSTGVLKSYQATGRDTGPPPDVTGLVLLDSAVVVNP